MIMGHVVHQNDRLVKTYYNQKENLKKNLYFWLPWLPKQMSHFQFFLIFFGGGRSMMGHVVHQNDRLVKTYYKNQKE